VQKFTLAIFGACISVGAKELRKVQQPSGPSSPHSVDELFDMGKCEHSSTSLLWCLD